MVYAVFLILLILVYAMAQAKRLIAYGQKVRQTEEDCLRDFIDRKKENDVIVSELTSLETKITEFFFFYELTRKVAPILDKTALVDTFIDDMKFIGEVKRVSVSCEGKPDCLTIYLDDAQAEPIYLETQSEKVKEYLPYFINLLRLCNERAELYERLQQLSIYDSLTSTYNRRYFMMRFAEEFSRACKHKLNLSFLMIDIDNFKKINDTYGHIVGDLVLKKLGKILLDIVGDSGNICCRFGGEEFVFYIVECNKKELVEIAQKIRKQIANTSVHFRRKLINFTVSVGLAHFPEHGDDVLDLLDKADHNLYTAKNSGKNKVKI